MLDQFLDWLARLPAVPIYLVLMVLSALENAFPPVPADVAVAIGAFLARRGEVSVFPSPSWAGSPTPPPPSACTTSPAQHAAFFGQGRGRLLVPPDLMAALGRGVRPLGGGGHLPEPVPPRVRAAVTPFAGIVGMPAARALVPASRASAIWYAFLVAAGNEQLEGRAGAGGRREPRARDRGGRGLARDRVPGLAAEATPHLAGGGCAHPKALLRCLGVNPAALAVPCPSASRSRWSA